jgi:hypothetical protein
MTDDVWKANPLKMAGTVKKVNKKQDEWLRAFHRCGPFLQV